MRKIIFNPICTFLTIDFCENLQEYFLFRNQFLIIKNEEKKNAKVLNNKFSRWPTTAILKKHVCTGGLACFFMVISTTLRIYTKSVEIILIGICSQKILRCLHYISHFLPVQHFTHIFSECYEPYLKVPCKNKNSIQ